MVNRIQYVAGCESTIAGAVGTLDLKWHGTWAEDDIEHRYGLSTGVYRFNYEAIGISWGPKAVPVSVSVSSPSMPTLGTRIRFLPPQGGALVLDEIKGPCLMLTGDFTALLGGYGTVVLLGCKDFEFINKLRVLPGLGIFSMLPMYKACGFLRGVECGLDQGLHSRMA